MDNASQTEWMQSPALPEGSAALEGGGRQQARPKRFKSLPFRWHLFFKAIRARGKAGPFPSASDMLMAVFWSH